MLVPDTIHVGGADMCVLRLAWARSYRHPDDTNRPHVDHCKGIADSLAGCKIEEPGKQILTRAVREVHHHIHVRPIIALCCTQAALNRLCAFLLPS